MSWVQHSLWRIPGVPPGRGHHPSEQLKWINSQEDCRWGQGHGTEMDKENLVFFFFWPCHAACGILVPQPGIEPTSPALEARNLNHWTAREVPNLDFKVSPRRTLTGQALQITDVGLVRELPLVQQLCVVPANLIIITAVVAFYRSLTVC